MSKDFDYLRECGFKSVYSTDEAIRVFSRHPDMSLIRRTASEGGMEYFIVSNMLQFPDEFVKFAMQFPIHNSGTDNWSTTQLIRSFRQRPNPREFFPLVDTWHRVMRPISSVPDNTIVDAYDWHMVGNVYIPGGKVNLIPHDDMGTLVGNLWLSKGMGTAGTAFYKLKLNGKEFYRRSELNEKENKQLADINNELAAKPYPWKPWEPNDYWKPYFLTPANYNSSVIYNGDYFHQGVYDEFMHKDMRYSIVGFFHHDKKLKELGLK